MLIKNIQKHEIVSPVANGIASDVHSRHISEQIEKHLKNVFEKSQEVREEGLPPIKKPTLEDQAKKLGIKKDKSKIHEVQDLEKLFEGIVDDEITITPLPPLKNEEVAVSEYIQQNPKTVSSKLLSLLISEAKANDGSPITEAQKQSVIREFINDVGGGIINLEGKVGASLRENYPTLMDVIDKSLETVGAVMMASAKGWTLALSDAKSDAEASQKVAEFVVGVEETLNKYTSKEERKMLEYTVGGALVGKAAKYSLSKLFDVKDVAPNKANAFEDISVITKVTNDPYTEAMTGGKHSGWVKQCLDKSEKEIEKGIQSFQKQIDLHKDKIRNPSKHIQNWDGLHSEHKKDLLYNKWPSDIKRQSELKFILEKILEDKNAR